MKNRIIVLTKNGEEKRFPLDKERVILGRDKSCDIVLGNEGISRKHAAILFKFDAVYIENLSSGASILKDDQPVEYSALAEGDNVLIGEFQLHWQFEDELNAAPDQGADSGAVPEGGGVAPANFSVGEVVNASDASPVNDDFALSTSGAEGSLGAEPGAVDFEAVPNGDRTVVNNSTVHGMLKVLKGENIDREIKLDFGATWIVGRSPKCHVQIDSQKLSRQHFRIQKIGSQFRVQDLESANGTRVNGIAVTDAPLQPFDVIQIGPVELQFLIVDSAKANEAQNASAPMALQTFGAAVSGSADKTLFAAPVPYSGQQAFESIVPPPPEFGHIPNPNESVPSSGSGGVSTDTDVKGVQKFVIWYKAQPVPRRVLMALLPLLLLGLVFQATQGEKTLDAGESVATVGAPELAPAGIDPVNAADPRDVSADYSLLSQEKQNEIKNLYANADRARTAKDWRGAFDSSKKILSLVKRYKNSSDILAEAQTFLNEDQIGNISQSLSNVQDAAADNKERVQLLVENGEKALKDGRFEDAQESFQKAMTLDPKNDRVIRGLAAATTKDPNAFNGVPKEMPRQPASELEVEEGGAEREEIEGFRKQFEDAKKKAQVGDYREAVPSLQNLDEKLRALNEQYEGGTRGPASMRTQLASNAAELKGLVREALDAANQQFRQIYQTRLADAEQFVANRQYVEAREIYDTILKKDKFFEDAKNSRSRLYVRLIAEAKVTYQESLIHESVSDLDSAAAGFIKARDMLTNVDDAVAVDYYKKSDYKLKRLLR